MIGLNFTKKEHKENKAKTPFGMRLLLYITKNASRVDRLKSNSLQLIDMAQHYVFHLQIILLLTVYL